MIRTPAILGVHWNDTSISIVAVQRRQRQVNVLAWNREFLEPEVIVDGVIQNPKPIRHCLHHFIKNHRIKIEQVAFSLPPQSTRLTVLEVPPEQRVQAAEIIQEQLEHCKPFGRANIINGHVTYEVEQRLHALNAMTTQAGSDAALNLAINCCGTLDRLSPMVWPILEGLEANNQTQELSLLLILDEQATTLCVLQAHRALFCQTLSLSLSALVQDQISGPALGAMVESTLNYAQSMQTGSLTLRVASNGSYEDLCEATLKIRHALKDVQVKPLGSIQWGKPLALEGEGLSHCPLPALAAAWELARPETPAIGLHLVSPQTLKQIQNDRQIGWTTKIAALLVMLVGLSTLPLHWKLQQVRADHHLLTEQLDQSRPLQGELNRLHQEIEQAQQAITSYQQAYHDLVRYHWPSILTDIVGHLPQDTRLAEIWTMDQEKIVLTGQTLREHLIHQFSQELGSSSWFGHAVVDEISADPQVTAVVEFRITITLAQAEDEAS